MFRELANRTGGGRTGGPGPNGFGRYNIGFGEYGGRGYSTLDYTGSPVFDTEPMYIGIRSVVGIGLVMIFLVQIMKKLNITDMKKPLLYAGGVGGIVSAIFGVVIAIASATSVDALSTSASLAIEGVFALIVSLFIGVIAVVTGQMTSAPTDGTAKYIPTRLLSAISMFTFMRYGIETSLFLERARGIPGSAMPISLLVGAAIGLVVNFGLYKVSDCFSLKALCMIAVVFLGFFGAGSFVVGIHVLQAASGPIPTPVWMITRCCGYHIAECTVFMRMLFGYLPNATVADIVMYFVYHGVLWGLLFLWKWSDKVNGGLPIVQAFRKSKVVDGSASIASEAVNRKDSGVSGLPAEHSY